MKNFKNTFIPCIIFIIFLIIVFQVIRAHSYSWVNTYSYVTLMKWKATLNAQALVQWEDRELWMGDKIITFEESLAVIHWWDGSLTRMGENSEIFIQREEISKNKSFIDISFVLVSGKTWSQIVSFIGKDSSFSQSFDDIEAWVRGTVFDVDLSNNFIRVSDHEIELKNISGDTIRLAQWEVLNTKSLTLIEISEFLNTIEDAAWTELNKQFDAVYIAELTRRLSESIEIQNPFLFILEYFSPKYRLLYELDTALDFERVQKQLDRLKVKNYNKVYDAVFARYQDFNFVSADSYEFYKRKMFYKKALVFLADTAEQKEQFLRSSAYDLRDILNTWKNAGLAETLEFLSENKELLKNLDLSFLKSSFDFIPVGLREQFSENFRDITNAIPSLWDIGVENIWESIEWTLDAIDGGIKDFLDDNAWGIIDRFKN